MFTPLLTAAALSLLLLQPMPVTGAAPVGEGNLISPGPIQLTVDCDAFVPAERGAASINLVRDLPVNAGDTLIVTLCSNGTTGFSWEQPVFDPAVVAVMNHAVNAASDQQLMGAAGTETWTFRLLDAKAGNIDFTYSQPWSGGTKAAWTLRVNLQAASVATVAVQRSVPCGENGAVTGVVRPDPVSVKVGESFKVELCSNPSTGFAWNPVNLGNDQLQVVSHETAPASSGLIGAAGTETWTVKAAGAGDHDLVFWYLRSWEGTPQIGVVWLAVHVTE